MRFLLDNDVSAYVAAVLRDAGHECWTASEAGLAGPESATDDEVSVYAHDKGAVVVTHDREFSRRRSANTYGRHVWLRCEQPDAAELIRVHLDELVATLARRDAIVIEIRADGSIESSGPRWA